MGKTVPYKLMKCFGIKTDENLIWKQKIWDLAINLSREDTILTKVRNFIDRKTLRGKYHEIFNPLPAPHLHYSSLVGAKNQPTHTSHLFKECSILILLDKIALEY